MCDWIRECENAVCNVIQIIKQIPELVDTRLAVVGDLALWRYLPDNRVATSIDVVTNSLAVGFLKRKLVNHPNSPFTLKKEVLWYCSPTGRDIPINMSSQWGSHTLPRPEHLVHGLPYGEVPYVSLEDLALFKILSSYSKATNRAQRRQDAEDAAALLDYKLVRQSPAQRQVWVEERLRAFERGVMEAAAEPIFQHASPVEQAPYDKRRVVVSAVEVSALET
ncbi:hypothetical protein F5Y01DRAFT_315513 [Xylaria sp. FL0043]|nr:hypothetical protein F5Y01DRAFT_315513 [Xylaria sp. FL0043]